MGFEGWKGDFVGFLRGLEIDNSKRYFDAHRKEYELEVRAPMLALLEDLAQLAPELGPGKMFRLNRDIRFAADKSPYKTNLGAVAGPLYIHLDSRRFFLAAGAHMPSGPWLARYRESVAGPAGAELERIVAGLRDAGLSVGGNSLRTAPRGYSADHPRIEFLRWRDVTCGRMFELEPWLATPVVKDRVLESWRLMAPFAGWLERHADPA
ncbi:MAG: DUF2461 domain-containing protein [Candidatus Dormibacteraeota bacterium]|nr:DUF2461 domain-containing protein [Candidatus Dormibacteraeota bacterium]